jgi:hypothetical protein
LTASRARDRLWLLAALGVTLVTHRDILGAAYLLDASYGCQPGFGLGD